MTGHILYGETVDCGETVPGCGEMVPPCGETVSGVVKRYTGRKVTPKVVILAKLSLVKRYTDSVVKRYTFWAKGVVKRYTCLLYCCCSTDYVPKSVVSRPANVHIFFFPFQRKGNG